MEGNETVYCIRCTRIDTLIVPNRQQQCWMSVLVLQQKRPISTHAFLEVIMKAQTIPQHDIEIEQMYKSKSINARDSILDKHARI